MEIENRLSRITEFLQSLLYKNEILVFFIIEIQIRHFFHKKSFTFWQMFSPANINGKILSMFLHVLICKSISAVVPAKNMNILLAVIFMVSNNIQLNVFKTIIIGNELPYVNR